MRSFRRHVRERRVGEYNIGRHALRRGEARALRLERLEEIVRAGRRGGCRRALPAAFFLSALRRRLKVHRHGDLLAAEQHAVGGRRRFQREVLRVRAQIPRFFQPVQHGEHLFRGELPHQTIR